MLLQVTRPKPSPGRTQEGGVVSSVMPLPCKGKIRTQGGAWLHGVSFRKKKKVEPGLQTPERLRCIRVDLKFMNSSISALTEAGWNEA